MKLLITGHTGFKGAWLTILAKQLGFSVSGISLPPTSRALYLEANLHKLLDHDFRVDIRNLEETTKAIEKIQPDFIVHLAAQSLVFESYKNPLETYDVNVMGTANVLKGSESARNLLGTIVVTSDKVYKSSSSKKSHVESDPLGGLDPYSASKAAADILTQSWRASSARSPIAIARAGNVIGGGDWSENRLIPDMVKNFEKSEVAVIRNPQAVRPWQHVLDCLHGYLKLLEKVSKSNVQGEWNFGPKDQEFHPVREVVTNFSRYFDSAKVNFADSSELMPKETDFLAVNSKKARKELNWSEKYSFLETIDLTAKWYVDTKMLSPELVSEKQVLDFISRPQGRN